MSDDLHLPAGFWAETDGRIITIGMDESVKSKTGAFIELNIPDVGTVVEPDEELMGIIGTDEDVTLSLPMKAEVIEVNEDVVDALNITDSEWVMRVETL